MASIPMATTATKIKAPATALSPVIRYQRKAKSMAPKANRSTPNSTLLSTTPTKKPVPNSNPDPKLKPNCSHRGASLFKLSHTSLSTQHGLSSNHSAATPSLRYGGKDQPGGIAGVRTPVCYQRAGLPDADACTSSFEGSKYTDRPHVPEHLSLDYKGV